MESSRKRLIGLWMIFFFAAAILCSTVSARPAAASAMADCHNKTAVPEPLNGDPSSACTFQPGYGLPSRQPDIQTPFVLLNSLPQIDLLRLCLSFTSQSEFASHNPRKKIYLFNAVLTL
jgi:hypothetical protein